MRRFVIGAVVLAAISASMPAAAAPEEKADRRQDCRMVAPTTGSRLGARRVCRTTAEWRAIEEEAQRDAERGRSAPNIPRAPL